MRTIESENSLYRPTACAIALLWRLATRPLWAVLVILEPLVRTVLCGLALLVLLTALLFKFIGQSTVPFWDLLALSVACILLLKLYYCLMRWLA